MTKDVPQNARDVALSGVGMKIPQPNPVRHRNRPIGRRPRHTLELMPHDLQTVPRKLVQGTICLPVAVEGYEDVTLTLKKIKT